jgi:hypothetical protein
MMLVISTILTLVAPISVVVYICLAFTLYWACPNARWAVLIPVWYTVRDVYLFRRWKCRTPQVGAGYASRQAFFQALVSIALDILSRSLRRESFYRVLTVILAMGVTRGVGKLIVDLAHSNRGRWQMGHGDCRTNPQPVGIWWRHELVF